MAWMDTDDNGNYIVIITMYAQFDEIIDVTVSGSGQYSGDISSFMCDILG